MNLLSHTNVRSRALAASVAVLGLATVLTLFWPIADPAKRSMKNSEVLDSSEVAVGSTTANNVPVDPQVLKEIVSRPLFHKTRRPHEIKVAEQVIEEVSNRPSGEIFATMKLVGILLSPERQAVLLEEAPGQTVEIIRGTKFREWTLTIVEPGRAVFEVASEAHELFLHDNVGAKEASMAKSTETRKRPPQSRRLSEDHQDRMRTKKPPNNVAK